MAKITPQIIFKKESFIFGKDTLIEGTILLPGVDMGKIEKIQIEHGVWYGISDDFTNALEGFDHSKKKVLYSGDIPTSTLAFSFPLVYPNIKKTDGISYDGEYSLIQNVLEVSIKETAIFSLTDSKRTIIPIEWVALGENSLNHNAGGDMSEDDEVKGDEEDSDSESTPIQPPIGFISLPWEKNDFVSKEYYDSLLRNYKFASLGDMMYKHPLFQILRWSSFIIFLLSIVSLIVSGSGLGYEIQQILVSGSLLGIFVSTIYLILQFIPKKYLEQKMNIKKHFPELLPSKNLGENLLRQPCLFSDLFKPVAGSIENLIQGEGGNLIIRMSIMHSFTYQSGKYSHTHDQLLIDGMLLHENFSSFQDLMNKKVILPDWAKEGINISDAGKVGIKKEISMYVIYDNLPDLEYEKTL